MKGYTIYATEDIARKAMEKGFECINIHKSETSIEANELYYPDEEFIVKEENSYVVYKLPTAEQICGWLREEKGFDVFPNIHFIIDSTNNKEVVYKKRYYCRIRYSEKLKRVDTNKLYKTYKEAILAGIEKAFELI